MTQPPNGSVSDLSEALRLAEWLDETETDYLEPLNHVATELRRLHEIELNYNARLSDIHKTHEIAADALLKADTLEAALRQALSALECAAQHDVSDCEDAIISAKQALEGKA